MSRPDQIPFYAADGTPQGFRSLEAALRLIAGGHVKPSYGRKRRLRAIWLKQEDGSNSVSAQVPVGKRYVWWERLPDGHRCLQPKRLDRKDEKGLTASGPDDFLRIVTERMR